MASGGKRSTSWTKDNRPTMKKGTKHKATRLKANFGVKNWDDLVDFVNGKGVEKLTKEMHALNGRDYAAVFLSLCEFVKPKLQRAVIAGDINNPLRSELKIISITSTVPVAESEDEIHS